MSQQPMTSRAFLDAMSTLVYAHPSQTPHEIVVEVLRYHQRERLGDQIAGAILAVSLALALGMGMVALGGYLVFQVTRMFGLA